MRADETGAPGDEDTSFVHDNISGAVLVMFGDTVGTANSIRGYQLGPAAQDVPVSRRDVGLPVKKRDETLNSRVGGRRKR